MNTGEDELSSGLNARLRPRKSNIPSPLTNKAFRKSDTKSFQEKPKRSSTPCKVSPSKPDDPVNKSDNTPIPQQLCPYCEKKFVSKQTALKHARRMHLSSSKQDSFIECLFCNHAETESNDIIRHMVDSHPNQYFACLDCHTRFSSTSDLAEHKLNVCEKQKLPYRSKLRQKSSEIQKGQRPLNSVGKGSLRRDNKDYQGAHGFNGVVISCELKPSHVNDEADIEDNITTNVILPPGKGIGNNSALIEKNAVIVLDDIQWNKRIPSNFSFHNTDADQILSRLGVVHRSPRTGESTKRDWLKTIDDATQKFEKCFDTSFYTKVASNVQENLSKYLDGSFNANPDPDSTIKTRKAKNCVAINTAEGFPILLACEQFSRNLFDGYMPRAIAPKHKWKWDSPDNDRGDINPDQIKRDSHLNNCIITLVSNLDIWTQLRMRRKFEDKFNSSPLEKKTEKQNTISKELKEILESRVIPTSSSQCIKHTNKPVPSVAGLQFPALLGLAPAVPSYDLQPAVLSGESVRPRCYVCCACGAQTRDSRALSSHISTQHPNALVQHYEIVGEPLLNADILKHLYVPPSQTLNRTRPVRGFRECTKCKKSITLEDLHQHMLDCAGDTPTVRRKCRYRPFGVRKRRPRLPDNRIRKKMRKDIRTGQAIPKNHMRARPRIRSEVGDAETIRKMLADLPAKRHRVMVNPLNSLPRKKLDRKRNKLMKKKNCLEDAKSRKLREESTVAEYGKSLSNINQKQLPFVVPDDDEDDNLPLKPKIKNLSNKSSRQKESLNRKAIMNRSKRKPIKEIKPIIKKSNELVDCAENIELDELSTDNTQKRININDNSRNIREHANSEGSNHRESNNRDDQQPGCSRQNGNSNDSITPSQNVPLKHSIARLTADSETHDKSVQFHRLFLVQQECNNVEQHLPSDRRVLFENEAVVTKLDKPPLHFNQIVVLDHQNHRKNKLGKPRKGLNDCIAMLKNKLVPPSKGNLPGHVSVQCGSDEPIEPEPIILEQQLDPKVEIVKKSVNVVSMYVSKQEVTLKKSNEDNEEPCKSNIDEVSRKVQSQKLKKLNDDREQSCKYDLDVASKGIQKPRNNTVSDMQSSIHCLQSEYLHQENLSRLEKQNNAFAKCDSTQQRHVRAESEITLTDLLSPPPRNTVIKKSPKVSVNLTVSQEESKTEKFHECVQLIESNDQTNQNLNEDYLVSKLPQKISQVGMSELNIRQPRSINTQNYTDFTNNNMVQFSPPFTQGVNAVLHSSEKEHILPKETDIQQNLDLTLNMNPEYSQTDFHDIPVAIPPAHASTTVESILSSPLDLSGRNLQIDTPENSSQEITFIMSSYDNYETLDLSNKSSGVVQSYKGNEMRDIDLISDVVVDLSIKPQLQYASQSVLADLSTKSTTINDTMTDLSYESINENVPTDLSLKKNDITTSIDLAKRCGLINLVHDLSNQKSKQKETINNFVIEINYDDKNVPKDLSGGKVKNKPLSLEPTPLQTEKEFNNQEKIMENFQINLTQNTLNTNFIDTNVVSKSMQDAGKYFEKNQENEVEMQESVSTNFSHSMNGTLPVNPLELQKANNDIVLIAQSSSKVSELKNMITLEKSKTHDEITQTYSKPTITGSTSESAILLNQSSSSFRKSINVVVPHEKSCYGNEKHTLSVDTNSISGTVPLYTLTNRSLSTYVPVCKFESTTPVYTLANACISVTRIDTLSSASLTNTLLSIPGTTIASTTSIYTLAGTTVDSTVNYGNVSIPSQIKSGNVGKNERCLLYNDRESSEVDEILPQSSTTNDAIKEIYDLTKEEIIDCDADQDTETARKIAMLPKELVKILGTMPIDHRNQLLNVLPQYVSTTGPVATADAKYSPKDNSSSESIRSPSPLRQQKILRMGRKYSVEMSDNVHITQVAMKPHIDSKSLSSNIDGVPIQVPSQQSVILKSHIVSNDHKPMLKNTLHESAAADNVSLKNIPSFSNQHHTSISVGDTQDAIIDLTNDENLQYLQDDVQVIAGTMSVTINCVPENRNLEAQFKPSKPKGNSDQTASLRAVRIKTPSERNKQTAPDFFTEPENNLSLSIRRDSVFDDVKGEKITNPVRCGDLHTTEVNTQEDIKNHANDTNSALPSVLGPQIENSDFNEFHGVPYTLKQTDTGIYQDFVNKNSKAKTAIIMSSIEENVSNIKRSDEFTCNQIKVLPVDSSQDHSDKTITGNDVDSIDHLPQTRCKEVINRDEDSDDDVSLAVIVKQKQRDQCLVSSSVKNNIFSLNDISCDGKKRKKDRIDKKCDIKDDNDEILLKKLTDSGSNFENETKNIDVSQRTTNNKNSELDSSECQDLLEDENGMRDVGDVNNTGSNSRKTRKSSRNIPVIKCVDESYKIQKSNLCKLGINKNNDVTAECSTELVENITKSVIVECDHSKTLIYEENEKKICSDVVEVAFRTLNKLTENVEIFNESKQKEKERVEENLPITGKENLQLVSKLTGQVYSTSTNDFAKGKSNKDNETEEEYNITNEFGKHKQSAQFNHICIDDDSKNSVAKISSASVTNIKCTVEPVNKTHHEGSNIEIHDFEAKSKKSTRTKKLKYANTVELSLPEQQTFESEESLVTPLRRSRRGKSMFVDSNLSELDITNQNDNLTEQKTPLTKKQLIFSKLLLDEESHTKPSLGSVKEPIVVISNIKLNDSHALSSVYDNVVVPQNYIAEGPKLIKGSKRKKSPQSKRKFKKLKSVHSSRDSDICRSSVYNSRDRRSKNNFEKHHDVDDMLVPSKCSIDKQDNTSSPTVKHTTCIPKKPIQNLEMDDNELIIKKSNINTNIDQTQNRDKINLISKPNYTEKRKISCTVTGVDIVCSSLSKKSKPNNIIESVPDSCKKDEVKQDNQKLKENCRKSRDRNNIFESSNKGYNTHAAARRTRSKSVVVKSSTLLYDPYDIDMEDMVDKTEPFGRKKSVDKTFENLNFMRDPEFKKRKKSETSIGVNTEPIFNGEFNDNVQIQCRNNVDSKEGISDSDDSSKSDIPLKKYAEEKERKNLELNSRITLRDETIDGEKDKTEKSENKIDLKEPENNHASSSLNQDTDQELKSEQFMESFGFFSERKPRKSNLLATKKISETFHIIANDTEEVNSEAKERANKRSPQSEITKPNEDESSSRDSSHSPIKKSSKRVRKKTTCTKFVTCYCVICKKEFRRPDNYLRHQMTLLHISKLSEVEMKVKTTPVHEEPNYLIAYKQQLDRLRILTDKIAKRKKGGKSTSKFTLPTLEEILADVNRTVREQQLSRRNLSRDEALFLDCCELLKESHKTDLPSTSKVTVTSDVNEILTPQAAITELSDISGDKNDEKYDARSDGDVDSITAKNILESEEVRNLENDLISGLKEAAANSLTHIGYQQTTNDASSEQNEEAGILTSSGSVLNSEPNECIQEAAEESNTTKPKKNIEVKDKMYPDSIDNIDIFEDKFDKIKRKCRSQAAAAKQTQPVIESSSSHKGRKKSEKKKGKKNSKKSYQNTILTKGALKGFDGIKVSIPTSEINISAIVPPIENSLKRKKKNNSKKKRDKTEIDLKYKNNTDYKHKIAPQNIDVYEFMDNEDAELFEFRPSTLMERFKNINHKDASTSKFQSDAEKVDCSSESGSDGDDFVYDDYVCSDDETENSLMSCELGNGKVVAETKKSSPSFKRKDVVEKNAVMGKIFKHNAVRPEKKNSKMKEHVKPKANLDQLFDSLLEDEPSSSSLINRSPNKEEFISPNKYESTSPTKADAKTLRYDSEKPCTSTSYKKDLVYISKKRDTRFNLDKPSKSRKSSSPSPREFIRISPKKHDSHKYATSSMEDVQIPSTSKSLNVRRQSSKKYDRLLPKEYPKCSPKRHDSATLRRSETVVAKKYDNHSPVYRNISLARHSKDKSPFRQSDKDVDIIEEYSQDAIEDITSDDTGVARQRARRKCTVGKQNVLAETWSSESEPDGGPPRPNSAESVVIAVSRKKKGKKKEGQLCGMRKGLSRPMPIKRQDVESRVNLCHCSASSASSSSSVGSRPSSSGMSPSISGTTSVSVLTSPGPHVPLGPPGPKVRPRSATYYWSSEGDEEQEHLQQHGWIVGDSHKKLVTMLAHAKGRKRHNDDKRHVIE